MGSGLGREFELLGLMLVLVRCEVGAAAGFIEAGRADND
jgi:hypothetical protein